MSLVRNLTRRARAHTRGEDVAPARSCTVKYTPGTINRAKISLPTELLSTTNVDALNAPDIRRTFTSSTSSSSSGSVRSEDFSSIDKGFLSADNSSSSDLSPITPLTPLSDIGLSSEARDFFGSKTVTSTPVAVEPTPAIPQRAPSHSKRAHVELSRQRSFKRSMSPPPTDIGMDSATTRDTVAGFSSPANRDSDISHPFGRELAKVDEGIEFFGGAGMLLDEEEHEMATKGLQKFTVADYLFEITGVDVNEFTGGVYEDQIHLNPWI